MKLIEGRFFWLSLRWEGTDLLPVCLSSCRLTCTWKRRSTGNRESSIRSSFCSTQRSEADVFTSDSCRLIVFPSDSCRKISGTETETLAPLNPIRHLIWTGTGRLTEHAVQTQDEADEALQRHVTRGGAVAQRHQVQRVVRDSHPWKHTDTNRVRIGSESGPAQSQVTCPGGSAEPGVPEATSAFLSSVSDRVPVRETSVWKKMSWQTNVTRQ